jgi:peptidoglycan/LPS O-acetylase OafA/YrhL
MNTKKRYRFEFLDALRGVAILAVMLLHFCERGRFSGDELVHRWVWPVLRHGYLGVQLFFVLSGYCIVAAVYGMRGKDKPLRQFVIRRARRILPPYWWSILLVVLLAVGTMLFARKAWQEIFPLTSGDWLANALLLQGPLQTPDLNLVYWSLSIEIQFYVLMSFCLLSFRWTELYLIFVSIASARLLALQVAPSGSVLAYWPEFACGIAAFYWITGEHRWRGTPWCLAGSAALAAGVVWYRTDGAIMESWHFALPVKLLFCLIAMVVLLGSYRFDSSLSHRALTRIFAWFGAISYSLYLIHSPLATRVFNIGERTTSLHGLWWLAYAAASFLVATLFGMVFYRYCERPWLNRRAVSKLRGTRRDAPLSPSAEIVR